MVLICNKMETVQLVFLPGTHMWDRFEQFQHSSLFPQTIHGIVKINLGILYDQYGELEHVIRLFNNTYKRWANPKPILVRTVHFFYIEGYWFIALLKNKLTSEQLFMLLGSIISLLCALPQSTYDKETQLQRGAATSIHVKIPIIFYWVIQTIVKHPRLIYWSQQNDEHVLVNRSTSIKSCIT